MSAVDRAVESIARDQHGAFTLAQAKAVGATTSVVRRRVGQGAWRREARGVYTHTAFPRTWEQRLECGVLSKPGAVAAGRSSAALHGLDGFRPGRLEIAVPPHVNHVSALAVVHRSAHVEAVQVRGIATSTIRQTLCDLAGTVPYDALLGAADGAVLDHRLTIDALGDRMLEIAPATPRGIADIRRLVDELGRTGYQPARNELERALYVLLTALGVPFVRQASFPWRAPHAMRVDAAVEPARVIVEADGRRWHTRVADFDRDLRRDHAAARHGWRVLRFSYAMLTADPAYVRATLEENLSLARVA